MFNQDKYNYISSVSHIFNETLQIRLPFLMNKKSIYKLYEFTSKPAECTATSRWIVKLPYTTNSKGVKWANSLIDIVRILLNFKTGKLSF